MNICPHSQSKLDGARAEEQKNKAHRILEYMSLSQGKMLSPYVIAVIHLGVHSDTQNKNNISLKMF